MAKLIWSSKAASDLEDICQYIEKDSLHYARIFAQRIVTIVEEIPEFPKSGRVVPEYNQETLREKIFQSYRIVYQLKPDSVEIVAIVHAARLLPDLKE